MTAPVQSRFDSRREQLLRLEEALDRMLDGVEPLPVVTASLLEPADVLGRQVVADLAARVSMPPWDDSAMDGFAVRAADVAGAAPGAPVRLRVTGEAAAGRPAAGHVEPGTAIRILTGAPVPEGADAVVPVESTDAPRGMADLPSHVAIDDPAEAGLHIRRAGSALEAGRTVVEAGTVLRTRHIGLLVAAGYASVPVHARPRVAVISTGDELAQPGSELGAGRIHDSNGPAVAAQVVEAGAEVVWMARTGDDLDDVEARLRAGIREADVVVVTGGVSVGAHDVVKEAFERVGHVDLWRVAVQPGKPLAFGSASREDGGQTLLFGLPGNPVSSFVTFLLFVRPVLHRLAGRADVTERPTVTATLAEPVTKSPGRRAFLRVRLERDGDLSRRHGDLSRRHGDLSRRHGDQAVWTARLAGGQGSHVLAALAAADGLAVVPEDVEGLPAGAQVEVWLLDEGMR